MELVTEELGQFNSNKNTSKNKHHRRSNSRNSYTRSAPKTEGVDKVVNSEWARVYSSKFEIFLFEIRPFMVGTSANVSGLRPKEEIGNKLETVDL
jgi:hypothetical protein